MTAIEQKVLECAAEAYNVDISSISLATNIREEISNKSLMMIAFVSTSEDELDVEIEIHETGSLISIQDVVDRRRVIAE